MIDFNFKAAWAEAERRDREKRARLDYEVEQRLANIQRNIDWLKRHPFCTVEEYKEATGK